MQAQHVSFPPVHLVFETNLEGWHRLEADGDVAIDGFRAAPGKPGASGRAYGIATLDRCRQPLPPDRMEAQFISFNAWARRHPDVTFVVADIRRVDPSDQAAYFLPALGCPNVIWPTWTLMYTPPDLPIRTHDGDLARFAHEVKG